MFFSNLQYILPVALLVQSSSQTQKRGTLAGIFPDVRFDLILSIQNQTRLRSYMPVYIGKVYISTDDTDPYQTHSLTHSQTTKYSATQLV